MDKETKRRVKIMIVGIAGIVLLLFGVSFAAFSASFDSINVQTVQTGCLKVDMADNGSLSMTNEAPMTDEEGLNREAYTYTLSNTCTTDAYYKTTINVMNLSNLDNLSKIKIALDGDTYLGPTIESTLETTELVDETETNVERTYKLDEGYLTPGETKTFDLRTWIDYDVTSITGAVENKIIVLSEARDGQAIEYNTNTPAYYTLSKNTVLTDVSYNQIAPISGVVKKEYNDSLKYYFRGEPNNYLTFGGITWKVLNTNNDGSINIVKDTLLSAITYANKSANLNTFYQENLESYETYIKTDQTFCEETQIDNKYFASIRVENYNPTGKCSSNNTVTKISIPSSDDLMFAGAKEQTANTSFYLANTNSYWTNSSSTSANNYAYTTANSIASTSKTTSLGLKPVITLKNDTKIKGEGTSAHPFYVNGKYGETVTVSDTTAPTITYAKADEEWQNTNKQIKIYAKDDPTGTGLEALIVKTTNETPSANDPNWEVNASPTYNTINTYDNGTYYVFAKDTAGNISPAKEVIVSKVDKVVPTCEIVINPNGTEAAKKTLSIETTETNIDLEGYTWDGLVTTKDVVTVTENGSYTGHLKDLAGNTGTCTGVITNITLPNRPVISENMIPVYYDDDAEVWKKADSTNNNPTYKWYDYDNKMWANSVTVSSTNRDTYKDADPGTPIPMSDILTMQVWIPRYKYKVWNYNLDGTVASEPQEIEITFEKGKAKTGEITCEDQISGTDGAVSEICKQNNTNCTDATCNGKTYTHPAFTFGEEEVEGIWVGKFELSSDTACTATSYSAIGANCNLTTIKPLVKPDVTSWRGAMVSVFENNTMAMNDTNNIYGFASSDDTHVMKNIEWGAVTYLSHSKYGMNSEVYINNSESYYTGRSGGNVGGSTPINGTYTGQTSTDQYNSYGFYTYDGYLLDYDTNTKSATKDLTKVASTTGNIYGIYDISGGSWDYVMGNVVSNNGTTMMSGNSATNNYHSGYTGILYDSGNYTSFTGSYSYPDNKYLDRYSFGTSIASRQRSKLGDGIKEIKASSRAWYSDYNYLASSSYPWFTRGGHYGNGASAGLFLSLDVSGVADGSRASRFSITP